MLERDYAYTYAGINVPLAAYAISQKLANLQFPWTRPLEKITYKNELLISGLKC